MNSLTRARQIMILVNQLSDDEITGDDHHEVISTGMIEKTAQRNGLDDKCSSSMYLPDLIAVEYPRKKDSKQFYILKSRVSNNNTWLDEDELCQLISDTQMTLNGTCY